MFESAASAADGRSGGPDIVFAMQLLNTMTLIIWDNWCVSRIAGVEMSASSTSLEIT